MKQWAEWRRWPHQSGWQRTGRSALLDTHLLPLDTASLVLSPGAWASSLQTLGPPSLRERTGQFLTIGHFSRV